MRSATRFLLGALALVLFAGTARAQNDVTFQVNMQPYITSCQFVPATDQVVIRGSINDWSGEEFALADADADGLYTGTFPLPEGGIEYKFFSTGALGYEDGTGNRAYTVVPGAQTIPAVDFADGTPEDICDLEPPDGEPTNYALTFAVDMSVQIGRGAFNPATQEVAVAGAFFNDWATNAPAFSEDSGTSGLYAGTINVDSLLAPGSPQFKFIIRNTADGAVVGWENVDPNVTSPVEGGNRVFVLTGDEPDADGDGRLEVFYDNNGNFDDLPFYSDQDASQFLTGPATVTFNVDARAAQYLLATGAQLPVSGGTTIDGLAINGPIAGESEQTGGPGEGEDWVGWGDVLHNTPERQLTNAGDNQWTITLDYSAGAARNVMGKFGINGGDNESAGGDPYNHQFQLSEGSNTFTLSFGCVQRYDIPSLDGRYGFLDESGGGAFTFYDEYLLIRNDLNPATCVTVTSGGVAGDVMAVASEGGPAITGLTIGAAYPNPVAGRASLDLMLDRAMDVAVRLFDVTGRQVATLAEGQLAAGRTPVAVDASLLAPGVYVLRVEADGQVVSRRVTVVR